MSTIQKIGIGLLALLVAFGFGRYLTPDKIVTRTEVKVVYEEREVIKKDTTTVIKETKRPDGTIEKETVIVDKDVIEKDKHSESSSKSETIVQNSKPQWSALVSYGLDRQFGAGVDRRILGPISVGIQAKDFKSLDSLAVYARIEF